MREIDNKSPKFPFNLSKEELSEKAHEHKKLIIALAVLLLALLVWGFIQLLSGLGHKKEDTPTEKLPENTLLVTKDQSKEIKHGPVGTYGFQEIREAVGVIDFDRYKTADVFSPYQGRINKVLVEAGAEVKKGQTLYTVLAPDIAQASSNLLSTSGLLKQANETLRRAKDLYEFKSISQKELEQNISDQQTAEGNFLAAKKTMALFGFSEEDINRVLTNRQIDVELNVKSPINGKVITRTASTGMLVQPGVAPAPITVSNLNNLWMVANIPESEAPYFKVGQHVTVKVQAYKDKLFPAHLVYVGDAVDPNTRRFTVYAEIHDSPHELKPQMLASFSIELSKPKNYPAVPEQALVRESNGTRIVWVTLDGMKFQRRIIKPGISQAGFVQVLDGLQAGEIIAQEKAIFLSNLYNITH